MAIEFDPTEQWDRVASELRAYKQTQQQAWGNIDNATLGRYLADDLSPDERKQIEQALTQLPELRKLTDIVRDVLDEFDAPAPAPVPQAPKTIPFPKSLPDRKSVKRIHWQRGTLLAAACLLLGLGLTMGEMQLFTAREQTEMPFALDNSTAERPNGREHNTPLPAAHNQMKLLSLRAAPKEPSSPKEQEIVEGWTQLGKVVTYYAAATQDQVGTQASPKGRVGANTKSGVGCIGGSVAEATFPR